jgi:carboxymethylenebutenolidase
MPVANQTLEIAGPSGPIPVRLSIPAGKGPFPAILLGQEGIGVTAHLRALGERFAGEGFAVAIPDLYARDKGWRELKEAEVVRFLPLARQGNPPVALEALSETERNSASRVAAWFRSRDTNSYFPDFRETLAWLAARPEVRRSSVGAVGFSFGGGLVGQILTSPALAAGAIFYGALPRPDVANAISVPLVGHFAEDDPQINPSIFPFARILAEHGTEFGWTLHPGTQHGFFNESRSVHHPEAARRAWASTLGFFRRHLSPVG